MVAGAGFEPTTSPFESHRLNQCATTSHIVFIVLPLSSHRRRINKSLHYPLSCIGSLSFACFRPSSPLSAVETLLDEASKVPVHLPTILELGEAANRASEWLANVENILVRRSPNIQADNEIHCYCLMLIVIMRSILISSILI